MNRFCDCLNGDDPMTADVDVENDLSLEGFESLQETRVMVQVMSFYEAALIICMILYEYCVQTVYLLPI